MNIKFVLYTHTHTHTGSWMHIPQNFKKGNFLVYGDNAPLRDFVYKLWPKTYQDYIQLHVANDPSQPPGYFVMIEIISVSESPHVNEIDVILSCAVKHIKANGSPTRYAYIHSCSCIPD